MFLFFNQKTAYEMRISDWSSDVCSSDLSITWLRANNYPDFKYLIDIQKMDDEAAFRFSDLENRARTDISDLERGRGYLEALSQFYDNDRNRMAERIGISDRKSTRLNSSH